jgi:hypothetical protein
MDNLDKKPKDFSEIKCSKIQNKNSSRELKIFQTKKCNYKTNQPINSVEENINKPLNKNSKIKVNNHQLSDNEFFDKIKKTRNRKKNKIKDLVKVLKCNNTKQFNSLEFIEEYTKKIKNLSNKSQLSPNANVLISTQNELEKSNKPLEDKDIDSPNPILLNDREMIKNSLSYEKAIDDAGYDDENSMDINLSQLENNGLNNNVPSLFQLLNNLKEITKAST